MSLLVLIIHKEMVSLNELCKLLRMSSRSVESVADPHLAMLRLRTTPVDHFIPSPAELLNSRVYQSNLPTISDYPNLRYSPIWTIMFQQSSNYDKISIKAIRISLQRLFPLFSQRFQCAFSILTTKNGSLEYRNSTGFCTLSSFLCYRSK